MISMFGILILLSALPATSYALSCTECMATSATCTGSKVTCAADLQCGASYTETTIAGTKTESLIKACMPAAQCGFKGSISLLQGQIKTVTTCCNTDDCDPATPVLPVTDTKANNVVCRSCASATDSCYTPDTIKCTGDENMCLLQTTKITGSNPASAAIRGCATKSICDLGSRSLSAGGTKTDIKYTCTNGALSVHKVVLTPAIVCLLLLKIFF